MSKNRFLVAAMAAVLAAGCSNSEPPSAASAPDVAPQPNPVAVQPKPEEAPAPVAGVNFTVSPLEFRKCEADKGRIVANVKWDVTAAGVQYVNVLIDNGTGEPTLFMTGKATGERSTGNWVVDGTHFILQNAANKKQLAVLGVSGKDC